MTISNPNQSLHNLSSSLYEHPYDKDALNALEKVPGIDFCVRRMMELQVDTIMNTLYAGSNIKVTPSNFPELHGIYADVCSDMSISDLPDLYISWEYSVNAFTTGVTTPLIVLCSGCIDLLEPDELRFIIGHELGHIKSGHLLYHQVGNLIAQVGAGVGSVTLGAGWAVSQAFLLALNHWSRMSEFTADRAGLLACQSVNAASRTMVKLAGLPKSLFGSGVEKSFLQQAQDFHRLDYDSMHKLAKLYLTSNQTHPWTVLRASELINWVESGDYRHVLEQCAPPSQYTIQRSHPFCPRCGTPTSEVANFCEGCGATLT
jgi:Zn-dependent protease with chaperone function